VHDTVAVGVPDGLGDLPQHFDPLNSCHGAGLLGEPEVKPTLPVIDRVDNADTQLSLHQIQRSLDSLVGEPS
jgi:hypothetical protein